MVLQENSLIVNQSLLLDKFEEKRFLESLDLNFVFDPITDIKVGNLHLPVLLQIKLLLLFGIYQSESNGDWQKIFKPNCRKQIDLVKITIHYSSLYLDDEVISFGRISHDEIITVFLVCELIQFF